MVGISKERLVQIANETHDSDDSNIAILSLLDMLINACEEQDPWLPIEEFIKYADDGLCWAVITGKVFECYFIDRKFYFGEKEVGRVIYDNITHVKPIHKPEPPR